MADALLPLRFEDEGRRRLVSTRALWDAVITAPDPTSSLELCASVRKVINQDGNFSVVGIGESDDGVYLSVDGMHDYQRMLKVIDETRMEKGLPALPSET